MDRHAPQDGRIYFRENELQLLSAFVRESHFELAPAVHVYGHKSIGKSYVVNAYLNSININKTVIPCDACVTRKLLLQRCLKSVRIDSGVDLETYQQKFQYKGRAESRFGALCDTFASFLDTLEQFFVETNYQKRHVLVLDRFDQCMENSDDLFASFLRISERSILRNMTIIIITSRAPPYDVASYAMPLVYFRPYTEDETVQILLLNQLCSIPGTKETSSFWAQYCKIVVDLYFSYSGCDLSMLIDVCTKLWDKFTLPVREGRYTSLDFVQVYRDRRHLFTDDYVVDVPLHGEGDGHSLVDNVPDLPYHSKFILIATYLASFLDPKGDMNVFSKLKARKVKKPKTSLRQIRRGLLSKEDIDSRLLNANYFDLERLLAILRVIYRNESDSMIMSTDELTELRETDIERIIKEREKEQDTFSLNASVELNSQIATLVSLGLLGRTSSSDILSSKARWRCCISWLMVMGLAEDVGFPIQSYLVE